MTMRQSTSILLILFVYSVSCSSGGLHDEDAQACLEGLDADCDLSVDPEDDADPLTQCVAANDCDGDGLYSSCDADDEDGQNLTIKSGCDADEDGLVNTPCTAYDNERDRNGDGLISAGERDVNCDVCTDTYDPEQLDTDQNGVGDACEYAPLTSGSSDTDGDTDTTTAYDDTTGTDGATDEDGDATAAGDDTGEDDDDVVEVDSDGDGLGDSIDPEPQTFSAWGIINPVMGLPVCLAEQAGFEYTYIAGTAFTLGFTSSPGGLGSADKFPLKGLPGTHAGALSSGKTFGSHRNLTIVQVDGMTDRSQASLDRIACGGISTPEGFEYGIYVVSPADGTVTDDKILLPGDRVGPVAPGVVSFTRNIP